MIRARYLPAKWTWAIVLRAATLSVYPRRVGLPGWVQGDCRTDIRMVRGACGETGE